MADLEKFISKNIQCIHEQIARAAKTVNRNPEEIRLVVVTKGHSLETTEAAISAGAVDLGENYVEEGITKILELHDTSHLNWHMIGHVQSRKAKEVCENFDWVHSLDSIKLANRMNRFAGESGRLIPVLLECNTSGEDTKFGLPAWREENWSGLLPIISAIAELPNLRVEGLMTMAPLVPDPEIARPFFRRLRDLIEYLSMKVMNVQWRELSMGMSSDFYVAIEEGATIVRIGQAILGPRLSGG